MTCFQTLSIAERCAQIQQQIPNSVRLIAVTKQVGIDAIRDAYQAGIRDFGESRIQEAIAKQEALEDLSDITWHLIGHLQSNKAKKAIHHFDWIHSLDSLKLAKILNQEAQKSGKHPCVCLQVKMRPDPNKFGWEPETLWQELPQLDQCTHLKVVGLMSIPPMGLTPQETSHYFQMVRDLLHQINQHHWQHIQMVELSMGMSADYELAIQAGATMIRPGRILFGERN